MFSLAAACLALATGVSAVQPFAASSCKDEGSSITINYDLTQNCVKSNVASQDSGGAARTVTVNVDFPADAIDNSLIEANKPGFATTWAVHVYDPEQGRVNGNAPISNINPSMGREGLGKNNLVSASVQQYTDQDEISPTLTQSVFYTTLTNPRGRWELTFNTVPSTDPLLFAVSIVKLSVEDGNFATNPDYPMSFTFGKAATGGSVPINMLASNGNDAYLRFQGYSPASNGRLVSNLKVGVSPVGARATSVTVSSPDTGNAGTGTLVRTGAGDYFRVALPPAAVPRTPSGSVPGELLLRMVVSYTYTVGSVSDYRTVDLRADGPIVMMKAGSTSDTFTEATALSPGGSAEIEFNLNTVSTDDSTARLPLSILKLQMPDRWWALRLTGSVTLKDDSDKVVALVGGNGLSTARALTPSDSAFGGLPGTSLVADPSRAGGFVVFNDGISTIDTTSFQPLSYSKITPSAMWLSGNGPSAFGVAQSLNWPYYDSRLASAKPVYVVLCANAGCGLGSVSSSVPQLRTATVTWAKTETFGGECTSNVACVTQADGKYPAADRASLSANGKAENFDTCILFADSTARNLETRCVECTSDCHCAPDQFCYRYTGIATSSGTVVDEQSRLLAGTCQRRDRNNTQIGKRCKPRSVSDPIPSGGEDYTFSSSDNAPYIEGEEGPVPCADIVYYNSSWQGIGAQFNYADMAQLAVWTGYCDDENMCRTCRSSWAGNSPVAGCSGGRVCVNDEAIYSMSMDGTPATLTADVRGSVLVALLFFFLVMVLIVALVSFFTWCTGRNKSTADRRRTSVVGETGAPNPIPSAKGV